MEMRWDPIGAAVDRHGQPSLIAQTTNAGCFAPPSPRLSCRFRSLFFFVQQKRDMHQSRWRHSRRLLNADTLHGGCISVLEYRSMALSVVGREAACQISAPALSISARLCFTRICCHFCLRSFQVFSCAPQSDGQLLSTRLCSRPEEQTRLFPPAASAY